jgi:hypothetical protein
MQGEYNAKQMNTRQKTPRSVKETEALRMTKSVKISQKESKGMHTMSSSDSSFSSSFFSSAGASASAGAAPPTAADAPTVGALPPAPTLERSSFTFFPSRALARRVAQIGSRSNPAAFVIARIFSDWGLTIRCPAGCIADKLRTVMSTPSSARMRDAYVAANSAEA